MFAGTHTHTHTCIQIHKRCAQANVLYSMNTSFQTVEQSLGAATTLSTPEDQVQALIKQVAEENDLEISDQLVGLEPGQSTLASEGAKSVSRQKEDALERR